MIQLAVSYGLMSLALYSASFKNEKLENLGRILVCGTVACLSLWQLESGL